MKGWSIKDITIIGLLSTILVVSKEALAALPNIELVSLLIIIYTLTFERKTIIIIYVFILIEVLLYGLGIWFFAYIYIWIILYAVTRIFRKLRSPLIWAVIAGAFGLLFGTLYSGVYLVTGGIGSAIAWWINGIPWDITHCIGNFVLALALFRPLYHILSLLRKKYES